MKIYFVEDNEQNKSYDFMYLKDAKVKAQEISDRINAEVNITAINVDTDALKDVIFTKLKDEWDIPANPVWTVTPGKPHEH